VSNALTSSYYGIILNRNLQTNVDPFCEPPYEGVQARLRTLDRISIEFDRKLIICLIFKTSVPIHEIEKVVEASNFVTYYTMSETVFEVNEYCAVNFQKKLVISVIIDEACSIKCD